MKILFLAANPLNVFTRLRVDEEFREIGEKIRMGPLGNQLHLVSEWAVRPRDLQALLLRHEPDIVHFSGHCSLASGIILEDEAGNGKVVSQKALADLFRILKGNLQMVVLNACYAKDQAQALASTIDFTIGMNAAIEDKAAIVFAAQFYQSLAFGLSVEKAFNLAVNELDLEDIDLAHVPELLVRDGADRARSLIDAHRISGAEDAALISADNDHHAPGTPVSVVGIEEQKEKTPRSIALLPWVFGNLALSLVTDVTRRFLGDGWPDLAALIIQSVFVALAVATAAMIIVSMIAPTHPLSVSAARPINTYAPKRVQRAAIFSGFALVIALGLWLSLPVFARYFNERGIRFQYRDQPDLSRARESYLLAVRLRPRFAQAHYNLAIVQENLEPEKAIEEYLLAIRYDSRIYAAYNNLARLYLLRGKAGDDEAALNLLGEAAELAPQDENVQYSLNKNLGWANYALKHYQMAETYLRRAIALRDPQGGAAAHCLLAYVQREQGNAGWAQECFDCVRLAPGERDVETRWVNDAKECLMKGGDK